MKIHLPVRKAILNRRTYEAPAEGRSDKLRLDFNENTSGCSPAVRSALARLTTKQLAMYPEYQAPTRRIARYFGVRPEEFFRYLRRTRQQHPGLRADIPDVPLLRRDLRRPHFCPTVRE
jgi:hypothetical protein